jgi:hypothetical protein
MVLKNLFTPRCCEVLKLDAHFLQDQDERDYWMVYLNRRAGPGGRLFGMMSRRMAVGLPILDYFLGRQIDDAVAKGSLPSAGSGPILPVAPVLDRGEPTVVTP